LLQNPRIHAGISTPVAQLVEALRRGLSETELAITVDDTKRDVMLRGLVHLFYSDCPKDIIFDTGRRWTGKWPLLLKIFPMSKIICCVREVGWIINSIERLNNEYPLSISKIIKSNSNNSVYSRAEELMNADSGVIGLPWFNLREAWFGAPKGQMLLVRYNSLTQHPEKTINAIYEFINEEHFHHVFDNLAYQNSELDTILNTPTLHTIRRRVEYIEPKLHIPPDLFSKHSASSFWERNKHLGMRHPVI
jgi:sulfotransferase